LRSAEPGAAPIIRANYFGNSRDLDEVNLPIDLKVMK